MTDQETKQKVRLKSVATDSGQVAIMSSDALDPVALHEALRNGLAFTVSVNPNTDAFPVMVRRDENGNVFEAAIDLLGAERASSPFGVLHERVGSISTGSAQFVICDPCHVVGGAFFSVDDTDDNYDLNEDDYEEACIISSEPNGHGPFLKGRGYVFAVEEGEECSLRTEPVNGTVGIVCVSISQQ